MIKDSVEVRTWSGHPKTENGKSAEENQVSRTSSSCCRVILSSVTLNRLAALAKASASVRPETQKALPALSPTSALGTLMVTK